MGGFSRWLRRAATICLLVALAAGVVLVAAATPAEALNTAPSVPGTVFSGRLFTITGAQLPRPPYSSAGTLEFQHLEGGAWRAGGTELAFSDALPFIVRPSLAGSMDLVSATAVDGPDVNQLVVSSSVPNSGIGLSDAQSPVSVLVTDGDVYAQSSRSDGTSSSFAGSRFEKPFVSHKLTMKVISAPVAMTSPSGALLQVFNASPNGELGADGGIYLRRNGAPPTLLKSLSGKQTMVGGPLVPVPGGVLMTYMVRNAANDTSVHVSRWNPELTTQSSDQTVCSGSGYNYQVYSLIRCADGTLVLPFVYAKTSQVHTGPWTLDVEISTDDGASWIRLNQPRTIMADAPVQAGIMEPVAVEVEPGQVAILFRCAAGYLGRVDLDLASRTLGEPYLTNLQSPLAGLSVLKLDSGAIAVAWTGAAPDAGYPLAPRKVVTLALSEDGLQSFTSVHVVSTSESLGDSMVTWMPYVHQPTLSEIDGRLIVGVERVVTRDDVIPYVYEQCAPILVHNVIAPDGLWHSAELDPGGQRLDLLAAFGPAGFEADGMIGPQSTWSAATTLPTGGVWRVRIVTASGPSAWTQFAADQASLTRPALSRRTVTFAEPALMTSRLLSAAGQPLPSTPVQLLRNGVLARTVLSSSDGTVSVKVGSSVAAHWRFRFLGDDSNAGVMSSVVRTDPKYALRVNVPASGGATALCRLSRGVAYAVVHRGRLRSLVLRGPSRTRVDLTARTPRFSAPATGGYSARIVMPGGGTVIIW